MLSCSVFLLLVAVSASSLGGLHGGSLAGGSFLPREWVVLVLLGLLVVVSFP